MTLDPFYKFHPGSKVGQSLRKNSHNIISTIASDPHKGFSILKDKYFFGKKNDFWDDYVFMTVVAPAINSILDYSLERAVNLFSIIDHSLFLLYLRRDEDPVRFRRAFWNLNSYSLRLADRLTENFIVNSHSLTTRTNSTGNHKKKNCVCF